jgi:ribosomal protein S18 acetylase RimI-like enzyme
MADERWLRHTIVRSIRPGEDQSCEEILRSLPDWFGIEEALVQYIQDLRDLETFVTETEGRVSGFMAIRTHNRFSSEIHVIGVRPEFHNQGMGRALICHGEKLLRARNVEFLQVKTLGPSRPDEYYDRTRGFYERLGFRPLEENNLWGSVNPCLIMVKHLRCMEAGPDR